MADDRHGARLRGELVERRHDAGAQLLVGLTAGEAHARRVVEQAAPQVGRELVEAEPFDVAEVDLAQPRVDDRPTPQRRATAAAVRTARSSGLV